MLFKYAKAYEPDATNAAARSIKRRRVSVGLYSSFSSAPAGSSSESDISIITDFLAARRRGLEDMLARHIINKRVIIVADFGIDIRCERTLAVIVTRNTHLLK